MTASEIDSQTDTDRTLAWLTVCRRAAGYKLWLGDLPSDMDQVMLANWFEWWGQRGHVTGLFVGRPTSTLGMKWACVTINDLTVAHEIMQEIYRWTWGADNHQIVTKWLWYPD